MLRAICLLALLLAITNVSYAQNVVIEEDDPIGAMMDRYIELNKSKSVIAGWRVQIMASPDRQRR